MNIFEKSENALGSLYVVYESPVSMEKEDTLGLSHLLEHMICCSLDDIEEKFDQHGLTTNAYTSEGEVVFFLQGLNEELDRFKQTFVERIVGYQPQEKDFLKELPIVLQEYADHYSDPSGSMYNNFLSMQHGFVGPIGVKAALDGLTFEKVVEFFKEAYSAPSKIIYVGQEPCEFDVKFRPVDVAVKTPYRHIDTSAQVVLSSVPMFISTPAITDDEHYHAPLISAMLGYGLKSPLYSELREKRGLCYWVRANSQRVGDNLINFISTSVSEDKVDAAGQAMLEVISNYRQHMTRERFDLIMQNRRISKKIADTNPASSAYAKHLHSSNIKWSFMKNIDLITYESTMAYFERTYSPENVKWKAFSQSDVLAMS